MTKKKESKMSEKQMNQIVELAQKIEQAIDGMDIKPEDELEIFSEAIATLINHWARVGNWTPLEHFSYAGYVLTTFMEHGVTVVIDKFDEYTKKERTKRNEKFKAIKKEIKPA